MAIHNIQFLSDPFGEQWTAWTDGVAVHIQSNRSGAPDVTAFNQATADNQITLERDETGRMYLGHLAADGSRLTHKSDLDGDSGSWSAL